MYFWLHLLNKKIIGMEILYGITGKGGISQDEFGDRYFNLVMILPHRVSMRCIFFSGWS